MRRREMGIAAAIYTLAGTGLVTLIYLLSKAMLKGLDWLTTKRRKPLTLPELKAKWSNVEVMKH